MPSRLALPVLLLLAVVCVAPEASARNNRNNTRTMKSIDISEDPAVEAAQKKRAEASKEYQAAQAKTPADKAAVESAKAKLDDATKELSETRKKAYASAKKKK